MSEPQPPRSARFPRLVSGRRHWPGAARSSGPARSRLRARPARREVGERPGALDLHGLEARVAQPPLEVVAPAARAQDAGHTSGHHRRLVADAAVGEKDAAGEPAARLQAARDLAHRPVGVRDAVQAGERDAEVELAVGELEVLDVGLHHLHLVEVALASRALGAREHRGRDVGRHVADPLASAEPAQRQPAAARHVEHGAAVGHVADCRQRPADQLGVGAEDELRERPAQGLALDEEVVDRGPRVTEPPVGAHVGHGAATIPGRPRSSVARVSAKRGIFVAPFDELADARVVAGLAERAEERGWDGFFVWDHVRYSPPTSAVADPWVTLTAIACATERVTIGPLVTPVSRRRPHKLARETVTLDRLSGGRLVLGAGLGSDNHHEFDGFGEVAAPRERAKLLDEGLDKLAGYWAGEF